MNSLLTVLTIDVLLTLGVIDSPWLYSVFLIGMVLVFGMPISDEKKRKKQAAAMSLQLDEHEKQEHVPEGWDYDYSVYRCKFDVI